MKKQSRLAVLLAAILVCVITCTGVAFATATELNSSLSDVEAALSAEEVQAQLVYNQLIETTTLKDFFETLMLEENKAGAYALNEEQLNGLYQYIQDMYSAIEAPTADDTEYYEMLVQTLQVIAEGNGVELLANKITDDYTFVAGETQISAITICSENGNNTDANWELVNGSVLVVNGTITVPEGQTLDIYIKPSEASTATATIRAGANLESAMFDVKGRLKIGWANGGESESTGTITIEGGTIHLDASASMFISRTGKVSGEWELNDTSYVRMYQGIQIAKEKILTISGAGEIQSFFDTSDYAKNNTALFTVADGGHLSIDGSEDKLTLDGKNRTATAILCNEDLTVDNALIKNFGKGKNAAVGAVGVTANADSEAEIKISNSTIQHCTATAGSAIYLLGSGAAKVQLYRVIVENCETDDDGTNAYGGAVRSNGNGKWRLLINQCVFRNNVSQAFGSCIYWNSSVDEASIEIKDSQFLNNTAESRGGAIFLEGSNNSIVASTGEVSAAIENGDIPSNGIIGTLIQGNSAKEGGGVCFKTYSNENQLKIPNTDVSFGDNVVISDNSATIGGGVACVFYRSDNNYEENSSFSVTVDGATISSNIATDKGGAIYITSGRAEYDVNVYVKSGTVEYNTAAYGGAIALNAEEDVENGGNISMSGGVLTNNAATEHGGGIYLAKGNYEMSGGSVAKNKARNGAGVYVSGGNFTMSNGSFDDNVATANGGAVYMADGDFTMLHGSVNHNSAANGGAVYMNGEDADFIMESGNMNRNTASNDGGAIYANGGELKIGLVGCGGLEDQSKHTAKAADRHHPIMKENSAAQRGGGIAIANNGVVCFYCGEATDNTARHKGGGANVFMDGGHFYLYDGANVGVPRDPDLVIVGGELHNECEEKDYVKLYYYQHNTDTETKMEGLAEYGEFMNLPDGENFWEAETGMTFFGWTAQGAATSNQSNEFVRNKNQYVESGASVQILDAETTETDQTGINTNKLFDGTTDEGQMIMHLYALWAPITNNITYVDGLNVVGELLEVEDGHTDATYQNVKNQDGCTVTIKKIDKPGYRLTGWYIYQDEGQNANWGYEPKWKTGATAKTYADLDFSEFPDNQFISVNDADYALHVDPLTFGDITLIANWEEIVVPIHYTVVGPENTTDSGWVGLGEVTEANTTEVTEYIGQATGRRYNSVNDAYTLISETDTDTPQGATPIPNTPNYKFVGWYTDKDCTTAPENSWISGSKLTPQKVDTDASGEVETLLYQNATYYALFDYDVIDLIIRKSGLDTNDSAIIKVTGKNTATEDQQTWYISLRNEEAILKDMKIGSEYTVEEMTGWTAYYNSPTMTYPTGALDGETYKILPYDVSNKNPNTVIIANSKSGEQWLHDENYAVNYDGGVKSSGDGQ